MNYKILLTSLLIFSLNSLAVQAQVCPTTARNNLVYQRRDGNRCEGLVNPNISGVFTLISFATSNITSYPETLNLKVPGANKQPVITVQSFSSGYLLDELDSQRDQLGFIFNLPTNILRQVPVPPKSLRAVAYTIRNSRRTYFPVILGQPSDKYEFILFAPHPTSISTIEIRRDGISIPRKDLSFNFSFNQQRSGQFYWTWDYSNANSGSYELIIVAEQRPRGGAREKITSRIFLEHNSNWF